MRNTHLAAESQTGRLAILTALLLILVVGTGLRFYRISYQSLWNDELSSWSQSNYPSVAEVIKRGVRPDPHPPGYQILLYFVERTLGESEFALRVPSAVAGVLSILAVFFLGAYIYTPKEGLLSAALMAASWSPIYYSQEARPYSFLMLLSILSSLAWFKMVRAVRSYDRMRWPSLSMYILAATLTCYTHYYGLLLVFLQGLYSLLAFVRSRSALIRIGLAYLAILALYTPWLPEVIGDLGRTLALGKPTLRTIYEYALFLFSRSRLLVLLASVAYGVLIWRQIRKIKNGFPRTLSEHLLDPTLVLLLWLAVPVLAAFAKSLVSTPVFTHRNLIICLPAAYLLLARFALVIPGVSRTSPVRFSICALLVGLAVAAHVSLRLDYYRRISKEQFREAVQLVIDNGDVYPNAIVLGCVWNTRYLEYYFELLGSPRNVLGPVRTRDDIDLVRRALSEAAPKYVWYVAAHRRPTDDFLAFLANEMRQIGSKSLYGAHVWLYEVSSEEEGLNKPDAGGCK